MKKLTAIALALVMLVLAACGVQQTPVTATALPGESAEPTHSPPPEPFAESAAEEGTDYTLERYEFTDGYYTFNNGALWKSLDAVPMNSGTHWGIYELSGGEAKQLEPRTFSADVELSGETKHVEFEWCDYLGRVNISYSDPSLEAEIYSNDFYDCTPERMLLGLYDFADGGSLFYYPVLANLETGEVSDVLAGKAPEHIVSAQLTPDGDMVLGCQEDLQSPISWHYLDLETGEMEDITDIVPAPDGQLASIYCTPLGGGVLAFYAAGEYPEGTSNYVELVYRTDINEGTLARIGREDDMDTDVYRGENCSRYVLMLHNTDLSVADILTGEVSPVMALPGHFTVCYSPDGTRALLMLYEGTTYSGLKLVDFAARSVSDIAPPEDFALTDMESHAAPRVCWLTDESFALDNGGYWDLKAWVYTIVGDGDVSVDPADYGISEAELSGAPLPDFYAMPIEALGAYYLNSDGGPSEGAQEALYRRFVYDSEGVLSYLAALGGMPSPHFPDKSAAGQICRAIAYFSAWMEDSALFDGMLDNLARQYPDGAYGELIDSIAAYREEALAMAEGASTQST